MRYLVHFMVSKAVISLGWCSICEDKGTFLVLWSVTVGVTSALRAQRPGHNIKTNLKFGKDYENQLCIP